MPYQQDTLDAIEEVTSAAPPPEIEPALWEQLRSELLRALEQAPDKTVSRPPSPDCFFGAEFICEGEQTVGLQWYYYNCGDYDQNSEVNINDLTVIGQHFKATIDGPSWLNARLADGDENGEINISDVTPIGNYYGTTLGGYNIYGGPTEDGPWNYLGDVPFAEATGDPWLQFYFAFPEEAAQYVWISIQPYDAEGWEPADGEPAIVNLGTEEALVSQQIGSAGGTVAGPAGSAIEHISVTFPEDALPADTEVQLGTNSGEVIPVIGEFVAPIISLTTGDVTSFNAPVSITTEFDPEEGYPIPYHLDDEGALHLMTITDVDSETGLLTFSTFHASWYVFLFDHRIVAVLSDLGLSHLWRSKYSKDTGFNFGADCMNIDNDRADRLPHYQDGVCLGIAAFAQWYFKHERYPNDYFTSLCRFHKDEYTANDPIPESELIQWIIATRAYTSSQSSLAYLILFDLWQCVVDFNHGQVYVLVTNAMLNTGQPQLLDVRKSSTSGGHAVLAYAALNGVVYIYDPNHPYTQQHLTFAENAEDVTSLNDGYTHVRYIGDGSLCWTEPFENIYNDAELSPPFGGSKNATILIESPKDGSIASSTEVTLKGKVESGYILARWLEVKLGDSSYTADLPLSGEFSLNIPIKANTMNELQFITTGEIYATFEPWMPDEEIENNYKDKTFVIYGPSETYELKVELTYAAASEPLTDLRSHLKIYLTGPANPHYVTGGGWPHTDGSETTLPYATCQTLSTYTGSSYDKKVVDGLQITTIYNSEPVKHNYLILGMEKDWNAHGTMVKIYDSSTLKHSLTPPQVSGSDPDKEIVWSVFSYDGSTNELKITDELI